MQLKGVQSGFKKTMCAMTPTLPPSMILDRQPHVIYYDSDGIEIWRPKLELKRLKWTSVQTGPPSASPSSDVGI